MTTPSRQHAARPRAPVVGLLVVLALLGLQPLPASADPYAEDPLGIVAEAGWTRTYATGLDSWEVIVCRVPDGGVDLSPSQAASIFQSVVSPYFLWLSGGTYAPSFQAGPTVSSPVSSEWPDDPFARQFDCEQRARLASSGTAAGAIIVVDAPYEGGYGTVGFVCQTASPCPATYPDNSRLVVVGSGAVVPGGGVSEPRLMTVAHEIGHGISLPHSFGGLTTFEDGRLVWEYDNPMDLMSGGELVDLNVATLAINRYAAGWIDPDRVVFHRGGSASYTLTPPGTPGPQLLVLPTDTPGLYEVLGARRRVGYDAGIPEEGIEVYRIDQRGTACGLSASSVCWGADRRTQQLPAERGPSGTAHVFEPGESFQVRGATVEVLEPAGDGFSVRITGQVVEERFLDDDGNFHEQSIEAIADLGITLGCNPPRNSRYCPEREVTRAEMAAFLLRAVEDPGVLEGTGPSFSDVPPGAWYAPSVLRLAELGITTGYGDGTYRPDAPVSRAEMAVFLARALPVVEPVPDPGGVFADVDPSAWFAPAVEGAYGAGVTTGCSTGPLAFCPHDAVLRDQMASFLARAL